MEATQIGIILVIGVPLMAWCLINTFQHAKQISSMRTELTSVKEDIGGLRNDLSSMKESFKASFEEMEFKMNHMDNKMSIFLKSEIDTLQEIARDSATAMKEIASAVKDISKNKNNRN